MPKLVQWSRFSDAFQRLFGLQGASSLNVVDDCFLTLPVEDELLHMSFLRGWTPFAARLNAPAVAGNFGSLRIGPAVGRLMVIERVYLFTSGTIEVRAQVAASLGGAGGVTPEWARDSRARVVSLQTATASNVAQVITTPAVVVTIPASPAVELEDQWVLTPGFNLVVEAGVVNIALSGTFVGRYREFTLQEGQ